METWGKKEAITAAIRYASVLQSIALSMDKAELEQADDFLAVLAREPGEEEVFNVGIHKKPIAKGDVVILGVQPIAYVGQQIVTGGESDVNVHGGIV